jgi:transcriptional regulator with XRE-family HTH domain
MTRNFNELKREVEARPGAPERLARYRDELERELSLAELRRARHLTQTQLASALGMTQPGISRIERQTDVYLSTLRTFVEALGGELQLKAVFPDGSVELSNLEEIASDEAETHAEAKVRVVASCSVSDRESYSDAHWRTLSWALESLDFPIHERWWVTSRKKLELIKETLWSDLRLGLLPDRCTAHGLLSDLDLSWNRDIPHNVVRLYEAESPALTDSE